MSINNVVASVAIKDVKAASKGYVRLLGIAGSAPMPDLAEWQFPHAGWLQRYQLPERAGPGSLTLACALRLAVAGVIGAFAHPGRAGAYGGYRHG